MISLRNHIGPPKLTLEVGLAGRGQIWPGKVRTQSEFGWETTQNLGEFVRTPNRPTNQISGVLTTRFLMGFVVVPREWPQIQVRTPMRSVQASIRPRRCSDFYSDLSQLRFWLGRQALCLTSPNPVPPTVDDTPVAIAHLVHNEDVSAYLIPFLSGISSIPLRTQGS